MGGQSEVSPPTQKLEINGNRSKLTSRSTKLTSTNDAEYFKSVSARKSRKWAGKREAGPPTLKFKNNNNGAKTNEIKY